MATLTTSHFTTEYFESYAVIPKDWSSETFQEESQETLSKAISFEPQAECNNTDEERRQQLGERWTKYYRRLCYEISRWLMSSSRRDLVEDLMGDLAVRLVEDQADTTAMADEEWLDYACTVVLRVVSSWRAKRESLNSRKSRMVNPIAVPHSHDNPFHNACLHERAEITWKVLDDMLDDEEQKLVVEVLMNDASFADMARMRGTSDTTIYWHFDKCIGKISNEFPRSFGLPCKKYRRACLPESTVMRIRKLWEEGTTWIAISRLFGISRPNINHIVGGVGRYKHLGKVVRKRGRGMVILEQYQVDQIRVERERGATISTLAQKYGVAIDTIKCVVHRKKCYANL